MPKIPVYTAEDKTATVQYGNAPVQDFSGLYQVGKDVQHFGSDLFRISQHIKAQKDATEAASLIGQATGKWKEISLALKFEKDNQAQVGQEDPEPTGQLLWQDPQERTKEFVRRAQEVHRDLGGRASSGQVSKMFGAYVARHFPVTVYSVHADGVEDAIKIQHAKMDQLENFYAHEAGGAATPEDRDVALNTYKGLVDISVQNRIFDPVQGEARKKRFEQKAQYEYMNVLRQQDPDKLEEEDKKGAFREVDPLVRETALTRAANEKAARLAREQVKLDKDNRMFVEGIERDIAVHIQNRTLTREKLEEARPNITSEKYEHYGKILDLQARGVGVGDPAYERKVEGYVYTPGQSRASLQNLADTIVAMTAKGLIGTEKLEKWGPHLQAEINRLSTEERTVQNEADNRKRQVQAARGAFAMENANIAFRNHGALDKFDDSAKIATEALGQFREEFMRNADYLGGTRDADELYRELLPKYIVHVDGRLGTRETVLQSNLTPRYMEKSAIIADRAKLGEAEYERRMLMHQELSAIQRERARLGLFNKTSQTQGPPVKRFQ